MGEQRRTRPSIEIKSTGQISDQSQLSDTALTNLFATHIAFINGERTAVWQRYQAMLVANSIFFGFFTSEVGRNSVYLWFGALFGFVLCVMWLTMNVSGFRIYFMRFDWAGRFSWQGLDEEASPIVTGEYGQLARRGGWVYWISFLTIILFMIGYVLLVAFHYVGI